MSDPRHYDLIIVGASFAGLACARTAALRGLKVAVIERKSDPGDQVRTTGILVKEAAEDTDVPAELTRRIRGVRLYRLIYFAVRWVLFWRDHLLILRLRRA